MIYTSLQWSVTATLLAYQTENQSNQRTTGYIPDREPVYPNKHRLHTRQRTSLSKITLLTYQTEKKSIQGNSGYIPREKKSIQGNTGYIPDREPVYPKEQWNISRWDHSVIPCTCWPVVQHQKMKTQRPDNQQRYEADSLKHVVPASQEPWN